MRLGALGYHSRVVRHDSTRVVLLFGDTVDDVLLNVRMSMLVERADDIDLIVLPWLVALVDVNDVVIVVNMKDRICGVPVDIMTLPHPRAHVGQYEI